MEILGLNHVALYVKDLERSIEFYGEFLELEPLPRPAFNFPGAWFRLGKSQELHLIGERTENITFFKSHHFALEVEFIAEAEEFLKSKKIKYSGPKERPDGAMQIFLRDPDGYFIEIFSFKSTT